MIFGSQIPIGIVHSSYSPFIYDKKTYTEEEADEKLQQQTALHEKNFYDSMDIEIKDRKITSQVTGEKMIYKVKYTLEGNIGMDYEIYVKK